MPGCPVHHGHEAERALCQREIRDVRTPDVVRPRDRGTPEQIGEDPVLRACHAGCRAPRGTASLSPPRSVVPAQAIFWKRDLHFPRAQQLFRIPDTTLLLAVVSSAKISGALSMKRRFPGPTESGRMPCALAICSGVLSPAKTSSTTCVFSLDVDLRLTISTSFAPARPCPEQPRSRRSTPQSWGVREYPPDEDGTLSMAVARSARSAARGDVCPAGTR